MAPPQDEDERRSIQGALEALKAAQIADPGISIPVDAQQDLETLLKGKEIDLTAADIGYRRRLCTKLLTSSWSLEFEGYFYSRDDNGDLVFWYGDREIWFTSFATEPAREPKRSDLDDNGETSDIVIDHDGIVGSAKTIWKDDHFSMSCVFYAYGSFAILTLIFVSDSDRSWAESVFRSVSKARSAN